MGAVGIRGEGACPPLGCAAAPKPANSICLKKLGELEGLGLLRSPTGV